MLFQTPTNDGNIMKCLVGRDRVAAGAVLTFVLHLCVVSPHVNTIVLLANLWLTSNLIDQYDCILA